MGFGYYLTKVFYSLILIPGNFIFLFFLSIFLGRYFKKLFIFFVTLFYLISTQAVGNLLLSPLEKPYNQKPKDSDASLIVVLGSGHYKGSSNLPLTQSATKRVLYAMMLAKEKNLPILFSGVADETKSAKEVIENLKKSFSIKDLKVYYENKAINTKFNALLTKEFIDKNHFKNSIYLVTSAAHMKRAIYNFKKQNLKVTPSATDFRTTSEFCYCFFFPSTEGLELSSIAINEYLAYIKDSFR